MHHDERPGLDFMEPWNWATCHLADDYRPVRAGGWAGMEGRRFRCAADVENALIANLERLLHVLVLRQETALQRRSTGRITRRLKPPMSLSLNICRDIATSLV